MRALGSTARGLVKRLLAARYERGGLVRMAIYCLLSVRFTQLANGPSAKLRIALATVTMAVAEALPRVAVRARRIPVDYCSRRYELLVGGCNDLDVLKAVLLERVYDDIEPAREPDVIVDLGSHIGASLLAFRARYPRARLIGAEPDPATFERLRANVQALADVTLANAAVAGTNGTVTFYPWRDSWGSSMFPTEHAHDGVEVRACTLGTLLDDVEVARVGLLKVNIEGAELELLSAFHEWDRVEALVVEWHGEYLAPSELERVADGLRDHFELTVEPVASRPRDYVIAGTKASSSAGGG